MCIEKESDLHTKRTGHSEFVDKTLESVKPISLEVPKAVDESEEPAGANSSSQNEGTFVPNIKRIFQFRVTAVIGAEYR